jgi:hypothetical protein
MKNLKPVPADKKKSLGKLPTDVRNKMGYAQKGKMIQKPMKAVLGAAVLGAIGAKAIGKAMKKKASASPGMNLLSKESGMKLPMKDLYQKATEQQVAKKSKGGEMASNRRKRLKDVQNPKSEYDKKGKLKYTAAKKGKMMDKKNKYKTTGQIFIELKTPSFLKPKEKSMGGEMKQGYGAARTSGMGLQDEDLIPGKSMDYYKDLM